MQENLQLNALFSDDVCIVGNATSLLSKPLGAVIDSHQTIVRLNRGFPKQKKYQGTKTDLVGLSCPISHWKYRWYYRKAPVIWMTERRDKVPVWMKKTSNYSEYPVSYWEELSRRLNGYRPSTGAMMIDLICHYIKPKKLTVVGFDFKKTRTLFENKEKLGPHNWALEEQYILGTLSQVHQNYGEWSIL